MLKHIATDRYTFMNNYPSDNEAFNNYRKQKQRIKEEIASNNVTICDPHNCPYLKKESFSAMLTDAIAQGFIRGLSKTVLKL